MAVEIGKMIEEFTAKLKPLTAKQVATGVIAAEKPPPLPPPPVAPPPEEVTPSAPCVSKDFKKMVSLLPPDYIGNDGSDIKDLVVSFLDSLPGCSELEG